MYFLPPFVKKEMLFCYRGNAIFKEKALYPQIQGFEKLCDLGGAVKGVYLARKRREPGGSRSHSGLRPPYHPHP